MAEEHHIKDVLLEPPVVESIKHARRRKYYLLVLMCSAAVMLAALVISAQYAVFSGINNQIRPIFLPIVLLIVLVGYYTMALSMGPFRRNYNTAAEQVTTEKSTELKRWQSIAEELSIGAAIPVPKVVCINLTTANVLTFKSGKDPVVGVSERALGAGLTRDEIAAALACQVARIATGTYVRPPLLRQSPTAMVFVGVLTSACIVGVIWMPFLAMLPYMMIPVVSMYLPGRLGYAFWPRVLFARQFYMVQQPKESDLSVDYNHQNTILCDSIAARLTDDPAAVESAIERLDAANADVTFTPADFMVSNFLFVCPKNPPELEFPEPFLSVYVKRADFRFTDRARNLRYVKEGTWRAFDPDMGMGEGVKRRPRMTSAGAKSIFLTCFAVLVLGIVVYVLLSMPRTHDTENDPAKARRQVLNKVIAAYGRKDWAALRNILDDKSDIDARIYYLSKLYSFYPPDTKSIRVFDDTLGQFTLRNTQSGVEADVSISTFPGPPKLQTIPEFSHIDTISDPVFISKSAYATYNEDKTMARKIIEDLNATTPNSPGIDYGDVYVMGDDNDRAAIFIGDSLWSQADMDAISQHLAALNSTDHLNIHQADFFYNGAANGKPSGLVASRQIPLGP